MTPPATASAMPIEELREKYRTERDKRLRADGNEQYIEVAGDFSRYLEDPYVAPGFNREAIERDVRWC